MVALSRRSAEDMRLWSSLSLLSNQISQIVERKLMRQHGLGLSDFMVLFELGRAEADGVRMLELAEQTGIQQSTLSRVAGRLERSGLVARRVSDADRRGTYIALTEFGRGELGAYLATFTDELNVAFEMAALSPPLAPLLAKLRPAASS